MEGSAARLPSLPADVVDSICAYVPPQDRLRTCRLVSHVFRDANTLGALNDANMLEDHLLIGESVWGGRGGDVVLRVEDRPLNGASACGGRGGGVVLCVGACAWRYWWWCGAACMVVAAGGRLSTQP